MVAAGSDMWRRAVAGALPWILAADAQQSPWDRLDPVRRTQVLMALLGLLLLGFLLIMLVLVGARYVRRLARQRPASRGKRDPLSPPPRRQLDDATEEPPPEELSS